MYVPALNTVLVLIEWGNRPSKWCLGLSVLKINQIVSYENFNKIKWLVPVWTQVVSC
jgi:hypothetical protein